MRQRQEGISRRLTNFPELGKPTTGQAKEKAAAEATAQGRQVDS
jgi:hypothetical protein